MDSVSGFEACLGLVERSAKVLAGTTTEGIVE
jgi:hypothetical protein